MFVLVIMIHCLLQRCSFAISPGSCFLHLSVGTSLEQDLLFFYFIVFLLPWRHAVCSYCFFFFDGVHAVSLDIILEQPIRLSVDPQQLSQELCCLVFLAGADVPFLQVLHVRRNFSLFTSCLTCLTACQWSTLEFIAGHFIFGCVEPSLTSFGQRLQLTAPFRFSSWSRSSLCMMRFRNSLVIWSSSSSVFWFSIFSMCCSYSQCSSHSTSVFSALLALPIFMAVVGLTHDLVHALCPMRVALIPPFGAARSGISACRY